MPVTAVVGAQWGDEGKGRIVDYLGQRADLVIRYQNGDNAGHTVVNEYGKFALHLVPCGIFNPTTRCPDSVPGPSSNFDTLLTRSWRLFQKARVDVHNLWIDRRAHVILSFHRLLDGAEEAARKDG